MKPDYSACEGRITLYCKNNLEVFPVIGKGSVELVVSDPPYIVSRQSNFHTMKDRVNPRTGTYFGAWDEDFDNNLWIEGIASILSPNSSVIVFNDFKKASAILSLCEESGLVYKDTLIWQKTNPMPRNRDRRYAPDIEMMQWYVKRKAKWVFNRQETSYDKCVIRAASESGGAFERYHPTQKPVRLIAEIVKRHSNPDDLVLDPFSGSASTAIACIETGRRFIGCEIEHEYFDVSVSRIEKYLARRSQTGVLFPTLEI